MSYELKKTDVTYVTYKPTEDNVQKLFEGKVVKEILFLRDKPDSPYGSGFNIYLKTTDGAILTIETEYSELSLIKATNATKEV